MTKAIRITRTGPAEAMDYVDVEPTAPKPGEALIRQAAIGLNYLDIYHRTGLYPLPLPSGLGAEGAGVVEAVGEGVSFVAPGDRVAYAGGPIGAYAERRVLPASVLVKLPDGIEFETAAALMLRGLTVEFLFRRTFPLKGGETILFHAAAGGGLLACQWARALGVALIGTVSSEEKAELARKHGAAHVINYEREDFAARTRELTHGRGVPVVYDSVGQATFFGSLDALTRFGTLVSFGAASGPVAPFGLHELAKRGSITLVRPSLQDYVADRALLDAMAAALFRMVESGNLSVEIGQRYALKDARQAHRDLEARKTTGSTILVP
jgi:NADPH2:quinone reductase